MATSTTCQLGCQVLDTSELLHAAVSWVLKDEGFTLPTYPAKTAEKLLEWSSEHKEVWNDFGRKLLRRFHMGTLMRIECASDPDRLRSHECALTWCASKRIHLVRWFGCAFQQDCIIHDSRKVTPTTRSLAWLAWLMVRVYRSFLFCSCSNVGEKRDLFADGKVEWYSMVKLKTWWFRCLQHLNLT